jgi:hypothetical protein
MGVFGISITGAATITTEGGVESESTPQDYNKKNAANPLAFFPKDILNITTLSTALTYLHYEVGVYQLTWILSLSASRVMTTIYG